MENRGAPQGAPQVVRVAKRTNPLGIIMLVVFLIIGAGSLARGDIAFGLFFLLTAFAFLGVKEDAER